jgi:hypothetical protein
MNEISEKPVENLPWVYLDHNILNVLVREMENDFKIFLKTNYQIVYSEETLKEIERSKGYENNFIDVLEYLDAIYIELQLTDKFRITDKINWFKVSPREVIKFKKENNDNSSSGILKSMHQMALKMAGGLKGESFDAIIDKQEPPFSKLMETIIIAGKNLNSEEIKFDFVALVEAFKQQFHETNEGLKKALQDNIPDPINFRGPKEFREKIQIGPRVLNNIKPPNVIKQIWEEISKSPEIASAGITLNRFLSISKNPIHPGEELTIYEKVICIYSVLNSIGYYPDSDMEKERRFVSSTSDSTHAAMGIFCKATITMDERFAMKVQAIYEFLGIGNQVLYIDPNKMAD